MLVDAFDENSSKENKAKKLDQCFRQYKTSLG